MTKPKNGGAAAVRLQLYTVIIGALFVVAELAGGIVLLAVADVADAFLRNVGSGLLGSATTLVAVFLGAKPKVEPPK